MKQAKDYSMIFQPQSGLLSARIQSHGRRQDKSEMVMQHVSNATAETTPAHNASNLNHLAEPQAQEYPWAAKMNPSTRNLHQVTTPIFVEDGTPMVTVPSHVLLEGIENQKEFIVGQFYRCSAPTGGQIHAVATRIWGKRWRIFARKLGKSSYLFHIPDENTRKWIIQRGLWHIDDYLMFVSAWNPTGII